MKDEIKVTFKAWDLGCLKGVLENKIQEVEQHMRICNDRYSPEAKRQTDAFLAQMQGCLSTVNAARAEWLKILNQPTTVRIPNDH